MTAPVSAAVATEAPAVHAEDSSAVYSTAVAALTPMNPLGLHVPSTSSVTPVSAQRAPVWTVSSAFAQLVSTAHAEQAEQRNAAAVSTGNGCLKGDPAGHALLPVDAMHAANPDGTKPSHTDSALAAGTSQ